MEFQPKTLYEAVDHLITDVKSNPESVVFFNACKYQGRSEDYFLSHTHHGIGTNLRNSWHLWWSEDILNRSFQGMPHKYPQTKPAIVQFFNDLGITHADDMSGIILTTTYRKYHGMPIDLLGQVQRYKDFWKNSRPEVFVDKYEGVVGIAEPKRVIKKFKYPLRIDGTVDQLKALCAPLKKLGYNTKDLISDWGGHIVTNGGDRNGICWCVSTASQTITRTVVSADNPELVLALAACVDDNEFHEGEILVYDDRQARPKKYRLHIKDGRVFFDWLFDSNIRNWDYHRNISDLEKISEWRKATYKEIINHFKTNTPMNETYNQTVCADETERYFSVSESFIKESHAAACDNCKEKIEKQFPDLFVDPEIQQFENELMNLINNISYKLYKKLPGEYSNGKAAHIINVLGLKN